MEFQTQSKPSWLSIDECIAAQQAIDAEIEALTPSSSPESIRNLRARRNAYALINAWLPSEIMVSIFDDIASTYFYNSLSETHNFTKRWVAVSHVCQLWRTIAIGTPRLWHGVSLANPDLAALMLRRSGTLPIDIHYWAFQDGFPSTLPLVLSHANRAAEITLAMPQRELQNLIHNHLTKPMPFLKILRLDVSGQTEDATPCFVPPGCLEGANALERLMFHAIAFSPQSRLPVTLTELALNRLPEKFTVPHMVALLEPLENLCFLRIDDALRPDAADPTSAPAIRPLPPRTRLHTLYVSAPARQLSNFLHLFPITAATLAELVCHPGRDEDFRFATLRPAYSAPGVLRSLSLSFSGTILIEAYNTPSPRRPQHAEDMCFSVSVSPPERGATLRPGTVRAFCDIMPLDSVETLAVQFTEATADLAAVAVTVLAHHLRCIRTLTVEGSAIEHVLWALHPEPGGLGPGAVFPCLRVLSVNCGCDHRYLVKEDRELLHAAVADCLAARKASGVAADVEELRFANETVVPLECLLDLEKMRSWEPVAVDGQPRGGISLTP